VRHAVVGAAIPVRQLAPYTLRASRKLRASLSLRRTLPQRMAAPPRAPQRSPRREVTVAPTRQAERRVLTAALTTVARLSAYQLLVALAIE
jgi:hypothetical protein